MSPRAALELALDGERRGHAYYAAMAATTTDAELRAIASEFASTKRPSTCANSRSCSRPARRKRRPARRRCAD
jgi:hypothetical protein